MDAKYLDTVESKTCSNCGNKNTTECIDCVAFASSYEGDTLLAPSKWCQIDTKSVTNGTDIVNHPPHYKSKLGLETIDVIEAFTEDLTGYEAVDTGNVIKYICRWKKKNGLQDLKKAQWYLNRLIKKLEEDKK